MAAEQSVTPQERAWFDRNARGIRLLEFAPRLAQLGRNGRWGTCVACPRAGDGTVLPELCEHTARYDHNLTMRQLAEMWEREPLFRVP